MIFKSPPPPPIDDPNAKPPGGPPRIPPSTPPNPSLTLTDPSVSPVFDPNTPNPAPAPNVNWNNLPVPANTAAIRAKWGSGGPQGPPPQDPGLGGSPQRPAGVPDGHIAAWLDPGLAKDLHTFYGSNPDTMSHVIPHDFAPAFSSFMAAQQVTPPQTPTPLPGGNPAAVAGGPNAFAAGAPTTPTVPNVDWNSLKVPANTAAIRSKWAGGGPQGPPALQPTDG